MEEQSQPADEELHAALVLKQIDEALAKIEQSGDAATAERVERLRRKQAELIAKLSQEGPSGANRH